jgi:hypothetical protein
MRLVRRGRGTDGRMCLDGVGASSSPENSSHGSEDPPPMPQTRDNPLSTLLRRRRRLTSDPAPLLAARDNLPSTGLRPGLRLWLARQSFLMAL